MSEQLGLETQMTPLDDLDGAFRLPEHIDDQNLRNLYEVLIVRMRKESAHLKMHTVQLLLIERIASIYITLRHYENTSGFSTPSQQREYNSFWLGLCSEFNRNMRSSDGDDNKRTITIMADVINKVLSQIPDASQRQGLKSSFVRALAEAGV